MAALEVSTAGDCRSKSDDSDARLRRKWRKRRYQAQHGEGYTPEGSQLHAAQPKQMQQAQARMLLWASGQRSEGTQKAK